jgi:RNA polymerase sigma-70 factor (ECF subfamily)
MQNQADLFWKLLEPEYLRAMMFCRKLMGDREKGDDLYQDALVAALTALGDLRDPASFRSWLYRIIVNTFRSNVRRSVFRRWLPMTPEIELSLAGSNPVGRYTARRALMRAFEHVSPRQQALVTLHELEGWSISDLADLYGKSAGAIKVELFRVRQKMQKVLMNYHKKAVSNDQICQKQENRCTAVKPELD